MLTSAARDTLRGVETVILDEVHAVAGSKRGAHLAVSLERLDALLDEPAQRIGLSATVRPLEEVARFLGGAAPVEIVAPPSVKRWELEVVVPVEDMTNPRPAEDELSAPVQRLKASTPAAGANPFLPDPPGGTRSDATSDATSEALDPFGDLDPDSLQAVADRTAPSRPEQHASIWPHVEERVVDLIEQHTSTIVFANSRRLAERLTARLNEIASERAGFARDEETTRPPAQVMAQAGTAASTADETSPRSPRSASSRRSRSRSSCAPSGACSSGPSATASAAPRSSRSPSS